MKKLMLILTAFAAFAADRDLGLAGEPMIERQLVLERHSILEGQQPRLGRQSVNWKLWGVSVAAHAVQSSLDGYTSWKQPEANALFRQASGPYAGMFYSRAVEIKAGLFVAWTIPQILILKKWPHNRRLERVLDTANFSIGAGYGWRAWMNHQQQEAFYKVRK
jgi:hypothetical protein